MKNLGNQWVGHTSVVFVLLVLFVCSSTATAATFSLYTAELPPYSFKSGTQKGAAVEIASALFERAKLSYAVKIMPWKRAYVTVEGSENACLFPVQRNQEREAFFQWVSPLYVSQTAFYGLKGDGISIRALGDVEGLRLGSYIGSAAAEYLQGFGYDIKVVASDKLNIKKLRSNRIDLWAGDPLVVRYFAGLENVELEQKIVYFTNLRALACSLKTPSHIIEKLQKVLNDMYTDGTIERILGDYR